MLEALTPEQIAQGIAIVIAGILAMPLTAWLKKKAQVTDIAAALLSVAVAMAITFLSLLVTGFFADLGTITWEALQAMAVVAWTIGQGVYRTLEWLKARSKTVPQ